MKKLLCILLVVCMLMGVLAACDDKGKTSGSEETVTIVGTWEYSPMNWVYTFNADGTGSYRYFDSDLSFTYTDDGSKIVIQYENSDKPSVYTYTIEGKILHIVDILGNVADYTKK